MKGLRLLAFALLFALPAAADDAFRKGVVVESLTSKTHPDASYAYYLPATYSAEKQYPVLFVFDPRSRGAFAADLFASAAEEFGWIVVSSNNSRSDGPLEPNILALNGMWGDVLSRFSVDRKRIYATGFSGGAILAWWLAESTNALAGVISVGGRVNAPENIKAVSFDWFGTAGDQDFNHYETKLIEEKLAAVNSSRRVETFEGGHRWAPKDVLRIAIQWMETQAMRRALRPRDETLIARALAEDTKRAEEAGDALESLRRYEAIVRSYRGIADITTAETRIAGLKKSADVSRLLREEKRAHTFETAQRNRLPQVWRSFLDAADAPTAPALAHALQLGRLQQMARENSYSGLAAKRIIASIYGQVDFYLPQEVSGPKLVAIRGVARMINPDAK